MTREEAERLRLDPENWTLGIIYHCREDPRIVVRNLWVVGWTWNFSHPMAVPAILGAVVLVLGPSLYLLSRDAPLAALVTAAASVAFLVALAHRSASGPRG